MEYKRCGKENVGVHTCTPKEAVNAIQCESIGLQAGMDIAYSKDNNVIVAKKTVFLFGSKVDMYGHGDTEEQAKKDLEETIRAIEKSMWI